MGINDKIKLAKPATWLTENLSESEIKSYVDLAKISATIEHCRLERKMTQSEFAEYMGVSQGMVLMISNIGISISLSVTLFI